MSEGHLRKLMRVTPAAFTAGDFVDGIAFLEPVWRRGVLFGMEHKLTCNEVIEMTHARASKLELTPLTLEIVRQQPRHIRLNYLFWHTLDSGLVLPLIGLADGVSAAFGGMSWDDLLRCYGRMVWVDEALETEHFHRTAMDLGILPRK